MTVNSYFDSSFGTVDNAWKVNQDFHEAHQQMEAWRAPQSRGRRLHWLDEAQLTNSSQHQQITPQSITETSRWTSNPLASVPLYSKMYFYLKRAARLLRNSPGNTLLTVFLVQEWVDIWMKSMQDGSWFNDTSLVHLKFFKSSFLERPHFTDTFPFISTSIQQSGNSFLACGDLSSSTVKSAVFPRIVIVHIQN